MPDNITVTPGQGEVVRAVEVAGAKQQVTRWSPHLYTPRGYEKLTVGATAVSFTVPGSATHALIRVEDAPIRWRDDGTNPTATDGMLLKLEEAMEVAALSAFRAIRKDSVSGTLHVHYRSYD